MPLAEYTIKSTLDISDSSKLKVDLSKIASGINEVNSEGINSKRTIYINSPQNLEVKITKGILKADLNLHDGTQKTITESLNFDYNNTFNLIKGENKIVIEWPVNSTGIIIRIYSI